MAVVAAPGVDPAGVLCASTGVIGVRLPVQKCGRGLLLTGARGAAIERRQRSTTHTRVKLRKTVKVGEGRATSLPRPVSLPSFATCFRVHHEDAAAEPQALQMRSTRHGPQLTRLRSMAT